VERDVEKVSLRETLGMMRHNRPLVLLCASSLLFLTGMFSLQTVGVYYARDVLGDANLYIVLTLVQTVGMVVAAAAVPKAVGALGKKRVYLIAGLVGAAASLAVAVAPGATPAIGIAAFGILGFGLGCINTLIFAFQADTVDYGEWNSGIRAEGSSYAVLSFTRKVGQGVGGAAAAFTIGLGGYVSGANNGPRVNVVPGVLVAGTPGPTLVNVLIGQQADVAVGIGLSTIVQNAVRAFKRRPALEGFISISLVFQSLQVTTRVRHFLYGSTLTRLH